MQTKAERLGPSEYLNPVNNADKIDIHDQVHARARRAAWLRGLACEDKCIRGIKLKISLVTRTIADFQKVNAALAVPEARRVAMQTENLD